jgi:nucleoid DNA-binding protein
MAKQAQTKQSSKSKTGKNPQPAKQEVRKINRDMFITVLKEKSDALGFQLSKEKVGKFLNCVEEVIKVDMRVLAASEELTVQTPFAGGTLEAKYIPAHESRNPATGKKVDVEARVGCRYSAAPKSTEVILEEEEEEEVEVKPVKKSAKKEEAKPTKKSSKKVVEEEDEDEEDFDDEEEDEDEEEVKPVKKSSKR